MGAHGRLQGDPARPGAGRASRAIADATSHAGHPDPFGDQDRTSTRARWRQGDHRGRQENEPHQGGVGMTETLLSIDPGEATGWSIWLVDEDRPIQRIEYGVTPNGVEGFLDY